MNVVLKSLGCRLNEAELECWASGFQADGHRLTTAVDDADLVVVNTCAVTREAAKKSRQLIRRAQRRNATAKLVVSGCYASLQPGEINELPGIDLVVRNTEKDRLVDIVKRKLDVEAMPRTATEPGEAALFARGRNRAFIKVQDGCRHKCTFCIVTVARGAERSRAIKDIIGEINRLHSRQILEVVLTGVHIGAYGHDLGTDLPSLIKTVLAETDVPRLRLGSLEPWNIDDDFFTLFENPRFMPHLHLPLQSGSDSVLRRMGRRCKTDEFKQLAQTARDSVPGINLTTDIIAGFPGETGTEWQRTLDFCREIGFPHIHVFPYSPRSGTRAATLPGRIPAQVKKHRCRQLHLLTQQMKHEFMRRHLGQSFPVLVESDTGIINGQPVHFGYSPNYLRTAIPAPAGSPCVNRVIKVDVKHYDEASAMLMVEIPALSRSAEPARRTGRYAG